MESLKWWRLYAPEGEGDGGGGDGGEGDGGDGGDAGDNGGAPAFELPEAFRADKAFAPIVGSDDPLNALCSGFKNAQEMVGGSVKVPGLKATDDERAEFYNKLGRPEKAEGYALPEKGLPEGFKGDAPRIEGFRKAAHALGLSDQQFAGLVRYDAQSMSEEIASIDKAMNDERAAAVEKLKGEWADAYDEKLALGQGVVKALGSESLVAFLDDTGLGDHPEMARFLAEVGKRFGEDEIVGEGHRRTFKRTPEEARKAIDSKMGDDDFLKKYTDEDHPGHADALEEMAGLHREAHPA